jgi:hypothetical protein
MSPYTAIPESVWRRWLRQERPYAAVTIADRPGGQSA